MKAKSTIYHYSCLSFNALHKILFFGIQIVKSDSTIYIIMKNPNAINRFLIVNGVRITKEFINNSVKQIEDFLSRNDFKEEVNSLAGMFRYYSKTNTNEKATTVLSINQGKINKINYIV